MFGDGNLQSALPVGDQFSSLDGFDKNLNILAALNQIKMSPSFDAFMLL